MKCGLQPQEKLEKMLIVLIGGFLIYILKHECHMDNGTVKAIIEFYACLRSYRQKTAFDLLSANRLMMQKPSLFLCPLPLVAHYDVK